MGKAAASIVIDHPVIGHVQIFNTHVSPQQPSSRSLVSLSLNRDTKLFAKGGEDGPEYNRAHRLVNAWEFAKLARQAADLGRYVIAVRHVQNYYRPLLIDSHVHRPEISTASQRLFQ